jgi:hypothetical protein
VGITEYNFITPMRGCISTLHLISVISRQMREKKRSLDRAYPNETSAKTLWISIIKWLINERLLKFHKN